MKLTRKELKRLIESFIVDDKGNIVSADAPYDTALDKAAAAMDRSRAASGKSPIGQALVRSSDPKTVAQGIELAAGVGAEEDYSDFESASLKIPEEDRQPNRPMGKLDSIMKAKYGQGQAMGEVYSLVVRDNMRKEVLIPIIDDHSEEDKKRGEGIPEDTMFRILDLYREVKKQKMIINQLAPNLDESDYKEAVYDMETNSLSDYTFSLQEKRLYQALEHFDRAKRGLKHYYFNDLLSNHVYELLTYAPYNYSYQNAQNFELLGIEPSHKELDSALIYASGLEDYE